MQTKVLNANTNRKAVRGRRILSAGLCGAISIAAVSALPGCEKLQGATEQADKTVDTNLKDSVADSESGGEKGAQSARSKLQQAAGLTQASSAARIRAKSALARDEFNEAIKQMQAITEQSLQIDQALWDLHQAGTQILGTQQTNGNYAKLEPKEALAKVEENRAAAKKALDKATADAAAMKAEIDKRQKEI